MVVIRDSMAEDLRAAREKRTSAEVEGVRVPPAPHKLELPSVPEVKTPADSADEIPIRDEYQGNASYELFKKNQPDFLKKLAEMEAEEKPLAAVTETATSAAAQTAEKVAADENNANAPGDDMQGVFADPEPGAEKVPGSFQSDLHSLRTEVLSRLGIKRVLLLLIILIAIFLGGVELLKHKSGMVGESKPAASNLFAEDLSTVKNDMDAARIKSVNTLAKAVVLYHIEERTDLPVSESYIKLNEVNPVTDFFKEALKKYGKSEDLLLDPRNPGYYYSYRSVDGQNIEFSAHLEDTGSARCANQDPCLFRVVLSAENIAEIERNLDQYKQSL
jgi:nitrogen fixation protein FixH